MDVRDCSVLIPAYGPASLLDSCLVAIMATTYTHEVLVWDNGVDHGEEEIPGTRMVDRVLERNIDSDILLGEKFNLGFSGACNRLAESSHGEILCFLNCDTEVQPGWLENLVKAFDDPEVGIAGSRLVRPDGVLHHSGVLVNLENFAWALEISDDLPSRDVDAVTGACFAIRRELFEQLGGFEEAFWCCYEDVDLCLRALQAGYRIRYVRESLVMHHKKATGSMRWAKAYHNISEFNERWQDKNVPGLCPQEARDEIIASARARGLLSAPPERDRETSGVG